VAGGENYKYYLGLHRHWNVSYWSTDSI